MLEPTRRRRVLVLVAISLLAIGLRAWGIDWGLPRVDLNPDELNVLEITQRISWDSLDPQFYSYSGLTFHLNFFGTELARLLGFPVDDAAQLLVHRLIGLLFGVLTALLVYPIGRRLRLSFERAALGALVFAMLPLHVWDTHFAVSDVGLAFWTTLALWMALRAYKAPTLGRFVFGGLVVGAAMATKFNGALAGATFIAVALLVWYEGRAPAITAARNLVSAGAVSLLGFAAGSPFSLINFAGMREAFELEWFLVRDGHYGFDLSAQGWQYHKVVYQLFAMFPFAFGIALWVAVLVGFAVFARRASMTQRALAWAHIGLYLVTTLSWTFAPMRYYLPILPIMAIMGGYGLHEMWRSTRLPRAVTVAAMAMVLGYTAVFTVATTYRFTDDTRLQAGRWGDAQMPRGSQVFWLYPIFGKAYMPTFERDDLTARSVPLEDAQWLAEQARLNPRLTWVVVSSISYQRDYRQGATAGMPGAPRRQATTSDPVGQWEFVRNNPDVFQLEQRFSSWYPNKSLYTYLDPMFDGYFVAPTVELYRFADPDKRRRQLERRARKNTRRPEDQR